MKLWQAIKSALRFPAYGGTGLWSGGISDWTRWLPGTRGGYDYIEAAGPLHQNGVVMACAGWIMRAFPEACIEVVKKQGGTGEENSVMPHPLTDALKKPNPFYCGDTLWQRVLFDRSLHGEAFIYKERNGAGDVINLWHVPQNRLMPQWPPDGSTFISHYLFVMEARQTVIPVEDLVHFRFAGDPDHERRGLPPLGAGLREVAALNEGGNYRGAILRNLGVPSHLLQSKDPTKPINKDQAEQLHTLWQNRVSGNERGRPIIPNWALEAVKIGFSPQELDLGSMLNWDADMVCSLFGLSSMVVGISSGSEHRTYANYEESRRAATENCLVPAWKQMGEELTLQLLPDYSKDPDERVNFNTDEVRALAEDQNAVWSRVIDAYKAEVIDRYRAIQLLGDEPQDADKGIYYQQAGGVEAQGMLPESLGDAGVTGKPQSLPGTNGSGAQPVLPAKAYAGGAQVGFRREEALKGWVTLEDGRHIFISDEPGEGPGKPKTGETARKVLAGMLERHQRDRDQAQAQWDATSAKITAVVDSGRADTDEGREELEKLGDVFDRQERTVNALQHHQQRELQEQVRPAQGITVKPEYEQEGWDSLDASAIRMATEEFGKMLARPELDGKSISVRSLKLMSRGGTASTERAFYRSEQTAMYLSDPSFYRTTVHELGHWAEYGSPEIHQKAVAFLEKRAGGEGFKKLRDVTGNGAYADDEVTRPDKFISPYVGKHYPDQRSTEVVSMGLEHMYADPAGFAKADPEHFDLIYGIMHGAKR